MNGSMQFEGKTYATRENALKAFRKVFDDQPGFTWFIAVNADGRFYPICIGESAAQAGAHFHFCTTN